MSYVIQNFPKFNQSLVVTPRAKVFVCLRWINFFLFFFKFYSFLPVFKYYKFFFKHFFGKGLFNFFHTLTINLSANYMNNVTFTGVYWNFRILNEFLDSNCILKNPSKVNSNFFFNLYFLPIKLINMKLAKTCFKSIFFYIIFFFTEIWQQFNPSPLFYLNFFFIKNNLKIYKFYNGYFLRVYNF